MAQKKKAKRSNAGPLSKRKTKKALKGKLYSRAYEALYQARRKKRSKKNAAKRPKSVYLKNFTGRVSQNPDKTISVVGRGRRGRK